MIGDPITINGLHDIMGKDIYGDSRSNLVFVTDPLWACGIKGLGPIYVHLLNELTYGGTYDTRK